MKNLLHGMPKSDSATDSDPTDPDQKLQAYILGLLEFRSNVTTDVGPDLIEIYDAGRDKAHELTDRIYDH